MQGSKNQSVRSCDYRCVIPLTSASPLEAPVDDRSTLSEYHRVGNRMAAQSPEWVTCKLGVYVEKQLYGRLEAIQMASIPVSCVTA